MTEFKQVVDLFAGAGGFGAPFLMIVCCVRGWVRDRADKRRHEEEMARLEQRGRELGMIAQAAFGDREATEPLARLLPTSSPPARPVTGSPARTGIGQ